MSAKIRPSSRRSASALLAIAALGLAACSGSTAATNPPASAAPSTAVSASIALPASPAPTDSMSAAPTDSATTAAASPVDGPTAVPTNIDPCQLISSQEAGQLAGASFGPGKEETTAGHARICTYGAQTKNVFVVVVAIAPDVATAKAEEAAVEAEQEANAKKTGQNLGITKMPGFTSDSDAVLMEIKPNSIGISGRSIYVLRGAVFFGFSDLVLGASAPSADAMKSEAMTVLGRLP